MMKNWRSGQTLLSLILAIIGSFCVTPASFAELDYSKLAGVHEVLKPEYGDLSPIYGFSHLRKGILENLYRFGDQERDQNRAFPGEDPTIGLIREMFTIPPGDQGNFLPTKLSLKPAYYFKSSTIGKMLNILIVKNAGWEGLKAKLDSGEQEKVLKQDLLDAIEDDLGIYSKVRTKINALKQKQKVREPKAEFTKPESKKVNASEGLAVESACLSPAAVPGETEVLRLSEEICGIQAQIQRMEAFQKKLGTDGALGNAAQDLEKWVELLLSALKASTRESTREGGSSVGVEGVDGGIGPVGARLEGKTESMTDLGAARISYPKEFPLQVLLSYFWLKAKDDPAEISAFFQQMPEALKNPEKIKEKNFLPEPFTQQDYEHWVEKAAKHPPPDLIQELEKNPEKALFYARAHEVYDRSLPPLVRQDTAAYHPEYTAKELQKLFADHKIIQCDSHAMATIRGLICYPDCFESTHRNLGILLESFPEDGKVEPNRPMMGRIVDTRWLVEKAKKLGHRISPAYLQHFAAHPSLTNPFDLLSRNSWSRLNCGLVPGAGVKVNVVYNKGECDMKPSVDNLLSFYEHHFFSEDTQGHYSKLKTRSEKLKYLCDFLSHDTRKLKFKLVGLDENELDPTELNQKNTDLILDFEINTNPAFRFRIEAGHAVPFDLTQTPESWKEKLASGLHEELAQNRNLTSSTRSALLAWYSKPEEQAKILSKLVQSGYKKETLLALFSQPLMDVEAKFRVMEAVATLKLKAMYSVARHLETKLPDDLNNKKRISALWADHGYPLGAPAHAAGKPELTYRPVSEETLSKLFTSEVAKQLGNAWVRTWTEEKREKLEKIKLIWGDTVRDEKTGEDKKMNWEAAKVHCLKLNSESKRDEVIVALEKIESNQELSNLRSAYFNRRNPDTKGALLKKYAELRTNPIPGCFLPPVEEFLILGTDLNENEKNRRYIPQFLPHLYKPSSVGNRWLLSSSGSPGNANLVFSFQGSSSLVSNDIRDVARSVRCTCDAPAW